MIYYCFSKAHWLTCFDSTKLSCNNVEDSCLSLATDMPLATAGFDLFPQRYGELVIKSHCTALELAQCGDLCYSAHSSYFHDIPVNSQPNSVHTTVCHALHA